MKKALFITLVSLSTLAACTNSKTGSEETDGTSQSDETATSSSEGTNTAAANQPKSYKVVLKPDSVLLGKENEALIKITGGTAVALQDPDGKDAGTELTLKLSVTNKRPIGGYGVTVNYNDSRLKLDNGTNITADNGSYLRADPESTSTEASWTYKLPAGTKPAALNLFMDETRVSVNVALENK